MSDNKPKKPKPIEEKSLAVLPFENEAIRSYWDKEKELRYLSVIDVIRALTDSPDPTDYWYQLKKREEKASGFEFSTICRKLKFVSADGKKYATECADVEGLLRIIQAIPSPKVEPLKQWLARVGYERIEENKDPEKAIHRAVASFERMGHDEEWIDRRLRSIEARHELTGEWKKRGIKGGEFGLLTNEVYQAWSGMTSREYRDHKGLTDENLRDHMTRLELILNMLAEASTAEIARTTDAQGLEPNRAAARKGGAVSDSARKEIESSTKQPVISRENYLPKVEGNKQLK